MNTVSSCKMTFDPAGTPLVLVDYGDEIPQVQKPALRKGLEVAPLIDALAPFLRVTDNNTHQFRIDVFKDETTDALAWQRIFEGLVAAQALGKKPLRVQVLGITDRYWQYAEAGITDHAPERISDFGLARYLKSYSVTAVTLTQVGP